MPATPPPSTSTLMRPTITLAIRMARLVRPLPPQGRRAFESHAVKGSAGLLLTICSRRNDTGRHGTTSDDTGRHVEPGSVPGRSALRIRCPKGRGGSTPPSRTS
jgi:hypothetical protein